MSPWRIFSSDGVRASVGLGGMTRPEWVDSDRRHHVLPSEGDEHVDKHEGQERRKMEPRLWDFTFVWTNFELELQASEERSATCRKRAESENVLIETNNDSMALVWPGWASDSTGQEDSNV